VGRHEGAGPLSGSAQARLRMPTFSAIQKWRPWNPFSRRLGGKFLRFRMPTHGREIAASNRRTYRRSCLPLPLVVCSPPSGQGSLWSTQEGNMFEQTDSALVMTLLALGGIALMADEKLGSTCLQMVKWIRTRGRH